jgi:predicted Zn-dependent protease
MRRIRRNVSVTLIILFVLALVNCVTNPVTGKKELMLISESMEIEMGKSTDASVREEYGLYEDPQLTAYVDSVARSMVPYCHRPKLPYKFAVLDTPVENAFAAPGGFIYITRGLLALLNTEAEMAGVLGHELGHVTARHGAKQMTRTLLLLGGVVLASALSEDLAKVAPFVMAGLQIFFLKYSRQDEYQADSLGVQYSRAVGYSPNQMVNFFASIRRLEESSGGFRLPNFLSTHPLTTKRIEEVQKMLLPQDAQLKVERNPFLRSINGLIYGDDPRQGYMEGNAFYHPTLKFYFQIPQGWKIMNTPKQVILATEDEKAIILLTAQQSGEGLETHFQSQLTRFSDSEVTEISRDSGSINGLSSFQGIYHVKPKSTGTEESQSGQEEKTVAVELDCIKKDQHIYTFTGYASAKDFAGYEDQINRTVRSFRRLTDPNFLNKPPKKIMTRVVQQSENVQSFLTRQQVPEEFWKEILHLNSATLDQTLEKNQLFKIIQQ